MFTGIVQEIGIIDAVLRGAQGLTFRIQAPRAARTLNVGDSVCTQGVCLTCVEKSGASFSADVSAETLRRTTLGGMKVGEKLNLELALRLADRLGGHLVSGHVDGVGQVVSIHNEGSGRVITFSAPESILRYTIEKGSVTVDGVSLTAYDISDSSFRVALIPHTLRVTTLGALRVGTAVNLEADLVGKYIERLMGGSRETPGARPDAATWSALKASGFLTSENQGEGQK